MNGGPSLLHWPEKLPRLSRNRILSAAALLILIVLTVWFFLGRKKSVESFHLAPVKKGDIISSIGASGTLEPEQVIDVGAQVAGRIIRFGTDSAGKPIDYGSSVERGTILAYIDESLYASDVAQAEAQVEQARAGVTRSEADLEQMKAKLYQTEREFNRAKELGPGDALSQSDYDLAQANFETAKANLNVGIAAIRQARLSVVQSEAALSRSRQNLSYCIIRSPIRGVIIDRRVNIGQTVVASLNAPSLFLIAKDLRRIQIWVPVNEADIGSVHPGQTVTFTVDAHPGETFSGNVGKTRLNATMTQNVVTYTIEVNTDNSSGKLLPYLTANVKFLVDERKNVLMVPNAALRWTPPVDGNAGRSERPERPADGRTAEAASAVVWILKNEKPFPVHLRTGLTDGAFTEIQNSELKEGQEVIIGTQTESAPSAAEKSPFTPQFPGRNQRRP